MKNSYDGGVCDYTKAYTCKKEHCFFITEYRGDCMHTTRKEWMKEKKADAKSKQG